MQLMEEPWALPAPGRAAQHPDGSWTTVVPVQSRAEAFSLGVHQRGAAEVTWGCDHKEGARWVLVELGARPCPRVVLLEEEAQGGAAR